MHKLLKEAHLRGATAKANAAVHAADIAVEHAKMMVSIAYDAKAVAATAAAKAALMESLNL